MSQNRESARRSVSEVRTTRRSPPNPEQVPGTSSNAEDRRKYSMHSRHKTGVHENLYVHPALRLVISGMSGLLFGIALEKSRVFEPQIIRDQMLFKRFAMLKMFLAAAGTGIVSFSIIRAMPEARKALSLTIHEYLGSIRLKTVPSVFLGSALLGSGMSIAGACPGLVTVQLGAGVKTAVFTVAGAMTGGFLYAVLFPLTWENFHPNTERDLNFLHEYVNTSYRSIALPLLIPIFLCVLALELYSPWAKEIMGIIPEEEEAVPEEADTPFSWWRIFNFGFLSESVTELYPIKVLMSKETVGLMRAPAWTPFFAGILVGLLQIPMVLANQDTLGTSTSYITIAAQLLLVFPSEHLMTYLKDYRFGWINWWQVFFIGGSVLGGFLSSKASDSWSTVEGVPAMEGFLGGMLMIYGARLAGGCTSGHGLSGIGLLAIVSFVAVPTMFASGILTAFALRFLGFEGFQ